MELPLDKPQPLVILATEFNGIAAVTEYPQEPASDPQDRFCKSVCGRIAGGLIHDTPVKDLREVKRWLDDHIENRDASPVPDSLKPF